MVSLKGCFRLIVFGLCLSAALFPVSSLAAPEDEVATDELPVLDVAPVPEIVVIPDPVEDPEADPEIVEAPSPVLAISLSDLADLLSPEPDAEDPGFELFAAGDPVTVEIDDDPPAKPLFYGSGYITGTDSQLGRITIYFPISYKSGYWGVDQNGYLFNVSSSSITGYLPGVYNNSISASSFSYPRYRLGTGAQYQYIDLHLRPESSNMDIATSSTGRYDLDRVLSLSMTGLLMIVVYLMLRKR